MLRQNSDLALFLEAIKEVTQSKKYASTFNRKFPAMAAHFKTLHANPHVKNNSIEQQYETLFEVFTLVDSIGRGKSKLEEELLKLILTHLEALNQQYSSDPTWQKLVLKEKKATPKTIIQKALNTLASNFVYTPRTREVLSGSHVAYLKNKIEGFAKICLVDNKKLQDRVLAVIAKPIDANTKPIKQISDILRDIFNIYHHTNNHFPEAAHKLFQGLLVRELQQIEESQWPTPEEYQNINCLIENALDNLSGHAVFTSHAQEVFSNKWCRGGIHTYKSEAIAKWESVLSKVLFDEEGEVVNAFQHHLVDFLPLESDRKKSNFVNNNNDPHYCEQHHYTDDYQPNAMRTRLVVMSRSQLENLFDGSHLKPCATLFSYIEEVEQHLDFLRLCTPRNVMVLLYLKLVERFGRLPPTSDDDIDALAIRLRHVLHGIEQQLEFARNLIKRQVEVLNSFIENSKQELGTSYRTNRASLTKAAFQLSILQNRARDINYLIDPKRHEHILGKFIKTSNLALLYDAEQFKAFYRDIEFPKIEDLLPEWEQQAAEDKERTDEDYAVMEARMMDITPPSAVNLSSPRSSVKDESLLPVTMGSSSDASGALADNEESDKDSSSNERDPFDDLQSTLSADIDRLKKQAEASAVALHVDEVNSVLSLPRSVSSAPTQNNKDGAVAVKGRDNLSSSNGDDFSEDRQDNQPVVAADSHPSQSKRANNVSIQKALTLNKSLNGMRDKFRTMPRWKRVLIWAGIVGILFAIVAGVALATFYAGPTVPVIIAAGVVKSVSIAAAIGTTGVVSVAVGLPVLGFLLGAVITLFRTSNTPRRAIAVEPARLISEDLSAQASALPSATHSAHVAPSVSIDDSAAAPSPNSQRILAITAQSAPAATSNLPPKKERSLSSSALSKATEKERAEMLSTSAPTSTYRSGLTHFTKRQDQARSPAATPVDVTRTKSLSLSGSKDE